jgi:hypothetical protein
MSVGVELRREREWQRRSLESVSETTKISVQRLKAIEAMDAASLPPEVYLRGHLRAYAAELGLNGDEITHRYLASVDLTPPAPAWSVNSPEGRVVYAARMAEQAAAAEARARAEAEARAEREAAARARAERRAAMRVALEQSAASGMRAFVATLMDVATTTFTRAPRARLAPASARTTGTHCAATPPTRFWPPSPMLVAALLAVVFGLLLAAGSDYIERRFPLRSRTTAITTPTAPAMTPGGNDVSEASALHASEP